MQRKKFPDSAAILLGMISIYTSLILTCKNSRAEMSDIRSAECSQFVLGTSVNKIKVCQGVCVPQKIPAFVTEEQRHAPFMLLVSVPLVFERLGH